MIFCGNFMATLEFSEGLFKKPGTPSYVLYLQEDIALAAWLGGGEVFSVPNTRKLTPSAVSPSGLVTSKDNI